VDPAVAIDRSPGIWNHAVPVQVQGALLMATSIGCTSWRVKASVGPGGDGSDEYCTLSVERELPLDLNDDAVKLARQRPSFKHHHLSLGTSCGHSSISALLPPVLFTGIHEQLTASSSLPSLSTCRRVKIRCYFSLQSLACKLPLPTEPTWYGESPRQQLLPASIRIFSRLRYRSFFRTVGEMKHR